MKKIAIFLFALSAAAAAESRAAVDASKAAECEARVTFAADFPIGDGVGESADVKHYTLKGENGKTTHVVAATKKNKNPLEWEEMKFSFTAKESGNVRFSFSGVEKKKNGAVLKLATYYDNFKIDGKLFPNGDFEKGNENFSCGTVKSKIVTSPTYVKFGERCLRSWARSYTGSSISVEKGKTYEVSVMVRPAGEMVSDDDFFVDLSAIGRDKKNVFGETPEIETVRFNLPAANSKSKFAYFPQRKNGRITPLKIKIDSPDSTGSYIYLLHRFDNLKNPDGSYIASVTIRTSDGKSARRFVLAGKDCLDADKYKPARNAKAVFFEDEKNKKGAWYLSRFEVPSIAPVTAVEFNTWLDGEWTIAAATISDKDAATFETWEPTPDKWSVADIPEDLHIVKGSALDQSPFFSRDEAGAKGRVAVSPRGTMAFEKTPDKDARFKSFTMTLGLFFRIKDTELRKALLKKYAEEIKRTGYNCVRMEYENYKSFKERKNLVENMDSLDFFFAELKKNGIYVHLVITWQEVGEETHKMGLDRDDVKLRCLFCEPQTLQNWKRTAELQMNHFNPYTKLAWKDDPMFLQVEHFNELSIVMSRLERGSEKTRAFVLGAFQDWLRKKYGTIEKLNEAWNVKGFVYNSGSFKFSDFREIVSPFVKNPDWQEFALERKTKYLKFCNKVIRDTGYKGIIASENITSAPAQNPPRAKMFESVIANTYFAHPSGFDTKNVTIKQISSIGECLSCLSSVISRRLADRPIGITEYNHCWWNIYRYEILGSFAPYAAFQNMSMLTIHEGAVHTDVDLAYPSRKSLNPFRVNRSPILRASELMATSFFIRGDVKPFTKRVDLVISENYLKNNKLESFKAVNTEQTKLALVAGFATDCEVEPPAALRGVKIKPADIRMPPVGSSDTVMEAWFQDVVANENGGGFNLKAFVKKMRDKSILPKDNITDVDRGVFQSDTGEIVLDSQNNSIKVSTKKSQLAVLKKSENVDLGNLKILSTTASAAIGITSLDGKPIGESSRLVLVYATQEANSGMATSFDFEHALTFGKAPIILKNGVLKAEIKLDSAKRFAVYPLALNGQRRPPMPMKFENGTMSVDIDNSKLPYGATTMFEIVAENGNN